ncbi:MAG TPA: ATP-binding protein [Thermoanaerobaculia bacterium]|jgi:signal transduction histidine kinase|nr:ATP-binding protein [Thermoanaerobaculia bacterium]
MVSGGAWSIRWWLSILAAALALPLLVLLAWLYFSQVQREEQEARETALRMARTTAVRLRELHTDAFSLLRRIGARTASRQIDAQSCESFFAVVDFDSEDENLYLFDGDGRLLCAGTSANNQAVNLAGQHWIERELQSRRLQPSVPMMGMLDGHWASALTMPVNDARGSLRATLVLLQLPAAFDESLQPDAVMTIVDREGTIISRSPNAGWSGRNVRDANIIQLTKDRREGIAEAKGVDGVSKQYGFTTLPELGWHIYVGIPTSTVMRPVQQQFLRGVAGGAVIVIAIIIIATMISRAIERPVAALSRAAEAAAHGAFESVTAAGPREIAQLAETFNVMLARRLEGEQELRALSERLLLVQEEERTRIARELHDDLGQALTALKMDVGGLVAMLQPSANAPLQNRLISRIVGTLDDTVTAVQRISSELRPSLLDDLGLAVAIEAEASRFEQRTGIECELSLPEHDGLHVSDAAVTAIYRIVQEALTNVARHANASRVELRLRQRPEELLLEIRDDGRGITAQEVSDPHSLGLIGIRERADLAGGTVHFEGVAGRGTIVSVRIPTRTAQT